MIRADRRVLLAVCIALLGQSVLAAPGDEPATRPPLRVGNVFPT